MSRKFTARGAVARRVSRFVQFAGVVLGLLVASPANADAVYQSTGTPLSGSGGGTATSLTATFALASSLRQGRFRHGYDGPCHYECGATSLLSWTISDGVNTIESSDELPGYSGYGAIFTVDAEDDTTDWRQDLSSYDIGGDPTDGSGPAPKREISLH